MLKSITKRSKSGSLELDEAFGFFVSMIQMQPIPPIRTFNHLFGALSELNHHSAVVFMYNQMTRIFGYTHFRPDICTLTIVIKCLCCLEKVNVGFSVLATIFKHSLYPEMYTLYTLLLGLCTHGLLAQVTELFLEIQEVKLPCDEVTFATMINGFCKAREICRALELLNYMHQLDVYCYDLVIGSVAKKGREVEALSLF